MKPPNKRVANKVIFISICLVFLFIISSAKRGNNNSVEKSVLGIEVSEETAGQGFATDEFKKGKMYYDGRGVPQDYTQAMVWFMKAAEHGNADAQNSLGFMYEKGQGVAQNYKEAVKWYLKAAEQGNADAQNSLGFMYESGKGVAQNYKEAAKWYSKAAASETVRGGHRLTGREFLIKAGKPEVPGYGLYSYVLFGEPLNVGNRDLYEAVVSSYLKIIKIRFLEEAGAKPEQLNITYLPLKVAPPKNPSVGWLLDHYHYARAQIILRGIENADGGGPYIISYTAPLLGTPTIDSDKLLVQDLSGVPADLAFLWVKEFISKVRRSRYWDTRALQGFMLSLRTNIAVVARAFAEVRIAHSDVASFIKNKIKMPK